MRPLELPRGGRRYLEIAHRLAAEIDGGVPAVGQRLPPERELAQRLDVSRSTVREALLALEIMRVVEIKVGSGVYVLPVHLRDRTVPDIGVSEVGPYEVLEVRRTIEGLSAYHAASRITAQELDALERVSDRLDAAIDDISVFDRADEEYHALIARAAKNAIVEDYITHLWRLRTSPLWNRWYDQTRSSANRRRSAKDHREILAALQRRQPEVAETAMARHIDVLSDRFYALKL